MSELRIMVDMSATLIHHGHVRLLKAAKELGRVIVALTTDEEVRLRKGYEPELSFEQRREVLEAIRYVDEVVPCRWLLDDAFLDAHRIDFLVHGHDNSNDVRPERLKLLPRTAGISSSLLRSRVLDAVSAIIRRDKAE
jgi:cytidyltransferase-like protein